MGHWTSTTYVNHSQPGAVAAELSRLCLEEGMEPIPSPPQRSRVCVEPMQYEPALGNDLWAAALFPGRLGWTVVQTAPLELLGERPAGGEWMRLAELCKRLAVPGFQFHLYDSSGGVLVEVSRVGEVVISGYNSLSSAVDPFQWNCETLNEEFFDTRFRLLPYQMVIKDAPLGDDKARAIAEYFGGENSEYCDNRVSVDTLICHEPFLAPGGKTLYFRWPGPTRQRYSGCASWAEYHALMGWKPLVDRSVGGLVP